MEVDNEAKKLEEVEKKFPPVLFRFYKITNSKTEDEYYGRTKHTLKECMERHSKDYKRFDFPLYLKMREIGFSHFSIHFISQQEFTAKEANEAFERLVNKFKPSLNPPREGRPIDTRDGKVFHKNERSEYKKKWHQDYKKKRKELHKAHEESLTEEEKDSERKHKRQVLEDWRDKNRDSKKYYCKVCDYAAGVNKLLKKHLASKKHKKAVEAAPKASEA